MNKHLSVIGITLVLLIVGLSGCTNPIGPGDTDGDGYNDDVDEFPNDSDEWEDSDGDGVGDNSDEFPNDSDEWEDSDGDGVGDNSDEFPNNSYEQYDSDKDGVGNNQDKFDYDSTQWADRDGDGYGDNPVGNNPDLFPDDRNEWKDSDSDGVGDNADIYDYGNAGISITIEEFHCDNPGDEWLTDPDPYFMMWLVNKDTDESFYYKTPVFWDDIDIYSYNCWKVDVNEDYGSGKGISFAISCSDDDEFSSDEPIDLDGGDSYDTMAGFEFFPSSYSSKSFSADGRKDYVDDEFDGWIEIKIEVISI